MSGVGRRSGRGAVQIEPLPEADWGPEGAERVAFEVSTNPGQPFGPIGKIASGGELSRFMLALKVVLAQLESTDTLIFDEVDAGIGGRVAEVVGRKLRAVARTHQVLCVTHLPQIASLADHHFAVSKRQAKGRTVTDVRALDPGERIEEVARMLGGETITDATRRHARERVRQQK